MFYLTGIVVTFFLSAILISKKGKTEADRILSVWLVAAGLHLTFFYLFVTGQSYSFPYILGLDLPFPLLHGPFLYLYTQSLTNQVAAQKLRWLHFLPFLLCYVVTLPFLLSPDEHKIFVYQNKGLGYETTRGAVSISIILSGIAYVILSLRLLTTHRRNLRDQFSYAEKINLAWLRYLIYGIAVIWAMVIYRNDVLVFSTVVLYVILLGYFGIKQVGIFTQSNIHQATKSVQGEEATPIESRKTKYQKSSLDAATAAQIHQSLVQLMQESRMYANPELTLAELAQALGVHPNNLSQIINTYEKKNFYDYINAQRIEEFKRAVARPENQRFTLLGLAHDCGFNSKTSFNRNFKNATGISPSEYLKQAHILLEA